MKIYFACPAIQPSKWSSLPGLYSKPLIFLSFDDLFPKISSALEGWTSSASLGCLCEGENRLCEERGQSVRHLWHGNCSTSRRECRRLIRDRRFGTHTSAKLAASNCPGFCCQCCLDCCSICTCRCTSWQWFGGCLHRPQSQRLRAKWRWAERAPWPIFPELEREILNLKANYRTYYFKLWINLFDLKKRNIIYICVWKSSTDDVWEVQTMGDQMNLIEATNFEYYFFYWIKLNSLLHHLYMCAQVIRMVLGKPKSHRNMWVCVWPNAN